MMLSKLGNIDAAQSTEYLTSVLNGFKLEAKDAESVVDRLISVDNAAATSAAELAEGLKQSANSAQLAGVDLNHLIAYIAVISDVSRKSGSTIGQSLQTMFSRLENVKLGKVDVEGSTINDVEKALARIDIKIRDSSTSFRDMQDVIDDVAKKWKSLSDVDKSATAVAIAGEMLDARTYSDIRGLL